LTSLRAKLVEQLSRFDEDAFAALANRGLLRRAQKDLEKQAAVIVEESAEILTLAFGDQRIRFDARGPTHASCTCPANGVCQHILAAAISLQRLTGAPPASAESTKNDADPLAQLQAELLRMAAPELMKHAGKAGYRWAWQYVQDLDPEQGLSIAGEKHLVLAFSQPRIGFRYMGGGLDALIADTDISHIEKYRVAAVLAFQRAHGITASPPEEKTRPRNASLDLGKDHAAAEAPAEAQEDSRNRLREGTRQLLCESIELGLSHLSLGIYERYTTLSVWAQGAEYYRLALLLRRIADHVEMLLDRAGGADEHRLFDEISLTYALVSALDEAASSGAVPQHLAGRARSRYEGTKTLELLGLGASAWRSATGYVGLTMLFWSPDEQAFLSCTDARPETQRGFNPIARYRAAGPWSGLGAPQQATGRRVTLNGAQLNAAGRISAAESTSATVVLTDSPGRFAERLKPQTSWSEILRSRSLVRRSLLAEPQPMKNWVILKPERYGPAQFDPARQTLVWPLFDSDGGRLDLELRFDEFTAPAITRIEAMQPEDLKAGTLVLARLRAGVNGLVGEPLSLVRPNASAAENAVDALYFDEPRERGLTAKLFDKLRRSHRPIEPAATQVASMPVIDGVLREFRQWLQHQSERGIADDQTKQVRMESSEWIDRLAGSGFFGFQRMLSEELRNGSMLLQLNYMWMQYERLMTNEINDSD